MFQSNFAKVAVGFVLGAAGMPVLKSDLAKKAYVYLTAGAFIARDSIMEEVEKTQATASDIAEDAKVIVEGYYAARDGKFCEVEVEAEEA